MYPTRRAFLAATTGAMALAGCLGGDDEDGDGGTTPTESPTPTPSPTETDADGGETAVQVHSHSEHGDILVGPDEMTVYMFDQDTQGEGASACYDDCADAWPPLTVSGEPSAGEGVTAQLETFERENGDVQVMAGGWPLYYFASDENPGDANGQGANDVWWVLAPDGTPIKPNGSDNNSGY